jgi:hypothetical protein
MVRISINSAAFDAIRATLPLGRVGFEREPDALGNVSVWLDTTAANQLSAQRRAGESYSDVILRLVAIDHDTVLR